MKYCNPDTKRQIELGDLSEHEERFYREALERFRRGANWLSFEDFAFSPKSPIYSQRRSHVEVLQNPLYLALKDMWLQLGVRQEMVARNSGRRPPLATSARRAATTTAAATPAEAVSTAGASAPRRALPHSGGRSSRPTRRVSAH